jgi:hypothetical protein
MRIEAKVIDGETIYNCNHCKKKVKGKVLSTYEYDKGFKFYHGYECFRNTLQKDR